MDAMDGPDWGRLFHAFGSAADVPAQLAALAGDDRDAAFEASVFVIRALCAGPVFVTATTDQPAKGIVALVILFSLLDIAVRARRFDARHAVEAYDRAR